MKIYPLLFLLLFSGVAGSGLFHEDSSYNMDNYVISHDVSHDSMDASQFIHYQNDSHIIRWYEWWYFSIKNGSRNMLIYFFTFGDLNSWQHAAGVMASFFDENKSYEKFVFSWHPVLDYNEFNITIGENTAYEKHGVYYIHFSDDNLKINASMETKFVPFGGNKSYFDSWQWGAWYVAIPYGKAHANIIIDGNEYEIKGNAYHDHNWGISKFRNFIWDWGEFGCDDFAVIYGIAGIEGNMKGGIHIVNATHHYAIGYDNISIDYLKWERLNLFWKPSRMLIQGSNSGLNIHMNVEMKKYYIIGWKKIGIPYMLGNADTIINIGENVFNKNATGFYEHHTPPLKKYL